MDRRVIASLAALTAVLAVPLSVQAAPLGLQHQQTVVADTDGDNIFAPGDTLTLNETLLSSASATLAHLRGTLTTQTPGISVPVGTSTFPDVAPGGTTTNPTPFRVSLPFAFECGRPIDLKLDVTDEPQGVRLGGRTGSDAFPLVVATGVPSAPVLRASADVPVAIPDGGVGVSTITVGQAGRLKGVRVKIGSITHTATGQLRLTLIAPDNTQVPLVDQRGGTGDDFQDTWLGTVGSPIAGASAPFTGSYVPEGSLATLVGHQQAGVWQLRAEDLATGQTGTIDDWSLELTPATCLGAPVASIAADPSPAAIGQTVTFDASSSTDPAGTITKYEWDLDGNGTYELDTGTTPTATHTYGSRQGVAVGLRVTSDSGQTGTTSLLLPITTPPQADFSVDPASPLSGSDATLDASASSDADGTVVGYEWDLDGDGTFETDGGTDPELVTNWATSGDHTVRLQVTDDNGATDVQTQTITVANRPPVASLTVPDPAVVGQQATFSAAASTDPDGTVDHYEWDLDGDGTYELDTGTNPEATKTYSAAGSVNASVRVTDDFGDTDVVTHAVLVATGPDADIQATPNPARPGQVVTLDASSSNDPDGSVVSYEWDLDGNGSFETGPSSSPTTTKTYNAPGTPLVAVRVTDDDGATATATVPLSVENQLPVASLIATPMTLTAGTTVVFNGSGSTDPDGSITKYEWDLDGNGSFETQTGSTPTAARSYPSPGSLTVRLRVTDDTLGTNVKAVQLTILPVVSVIPGVGAGLGGTISGATLVAAGALSLKLGGPAVQTLATVGRQGVGLTCSATRSSICNVSLELSTRDARRLKLNPKARTPMVVGRATVATGNGRAAAVKIRVSSALRKAIKRGKRVKLTARGSVAAGGGATASGTRAVTVRR